MSDNFDRTAFALQPAAPDENPFDWDWSALQEEVDRPIADIGAWSAGGLFDDVTLQSLEEEPSIPNWWNVEDSPNENRPFEVLPCGQDLEIGAELQPDR